MYNPLTKHRILHHPKLRLNQTRHSLIFHPQLIHLLPHELPVARALHDLEPCVPHLRFQCRVGQQPNLLRLGRDGLIFVPKLQVPWLEDGLKGMHGAAVFIPLERREEEVYDVRIEPRDGGLHSRGWVEN